MPVVGVVIIGRNEGERLKRCVRSLLSEKASIVYVDSGSDDGSVEFTKAEQLHVVQLDTSIPFSAGRARNEGMQMLLREHPELDYIQFVDGDCEVSAHWLTCAVETLVGDNSLAIVCGRRRERFPDQSVYNRMCDMEWNTPVGDAKSCGGDFLAVASALNEVKGFNPSVVAGEEPDLCYRLRAKGWRIERIDAEMTLHDAKILTFSQWWRRTLRSGHAYAHNMVLHWGDPERFNQRNVLSILVWGLLMPVLFLLSLFSGTLFISLFILLLVGVMILKIKKYLVRERRFLNSDALIYGMYTMLGKIPQAFGVFQFFNKYLRSREFEIIEYK
jgi:GT2 family glycosyltransferase